MPKPKGKAKAKATAREAPAAKNKGKGKGKPKAKAGKKTVVHPEPEVAQAGAEPAQQPQPDQDAQEGPGTPQGQKRPQGAEPGEYLVSSAAKRRQLDRRDSDEMALRSLGCRLDHIDPALLKSARDEDGYSVLQWIKKQMKAKKSNADKKGRLNPPFWQYIF